MRKNVSFLSASFICCFLFLCTSHSSAQRIYTIAGGTGNGCKLATGVVGFPVYMSFDKKNNVYATCYYSYAGAFGIRKYDFQNDLITTVAGNDSFGVYPGDGYPATQVAIGDYTGSPGTIAFDKNENLFITAGWQNCIRKTDTKGILTTVAGTGAAGFSGDGGPAKKARLNNPKDIAFDKKGNLYITDVKNNRIRRVDRKGIITTIAGNGTVEYNGDSIPAASAGMRPEWITIDKDNNLYVYDSYNKRIRKIDTAGTISNFAGSGRSSSTYPPDTSIAQRASLNFVVNIKIDSKNNLYLLYGYLTVYKISPDGLMTRFAGGGGAEIFEDNIPATSANFSQPGSIYFDNEDNLYIGALQYIMKVDSNNILHNVIGTIRNNTGSPLREAPELGNVAFNPYTDSMYVFQQHYLYTVDRKRDTLQLKAGGIYTGYNGDSGLAANAFFYNVTNVCFDKTGNTYIADQSADVIRKIDKNGIIYTVAGNGSGGYSGDGKPATKARLSGPNGVALDSAGNLYIADAGNDRIRRVDAATQIITTVAGNGGNVYAGDGGPAINASLHYPNDVAFDAAGNLYIADTWTQRVRRVDKNGIITTIAGNGTNNYTGDGPAKQTGIGQPLDITFDKDGNLYTCDTYNHHIYKINSKGQLSLYAGKIDGSSADGILPVEANIGYPKRIAFDAKGDCYISDDMHIRKIYQDCNAAHPAARYSKGYKYVNAFAAFSDACNVICTIAAKVNTVNALNSLVSSEVWIADSVIKSGSDFLVPRHYQLWAAAQPEIAKSSITFYFTQAEFTAYNRVASSAFTLLPKDKNDTAGKKYLRVVQYVDTLANGNALPPANKVQTLNPDDGSILWNDSLACWQVTLDVTGLGNFYVTSTAKATTTDLTAAARFVTDFTCTVYPNPAQDIIIVTVPGKLVNTGMQLIAADGKIVMNAKLSGTSNHLNIKRLQAGVYTMKFSDGTFQRIIKQ